MAEAETKDPTIIENPVKEATSTLIPLSIPATLPDKKNAIVITDKNTKAVVYQANLNENMISKLMKCLGPKLPPVAAAAVTTTSTPEAAVAAAQPATPATLVEKPEETTANPPPVKTGGKRRKTKRAYKNLARKSKKHT